MTKYRYSLAAIALAVGLAGSGAVILPAAAQSDTAAPSAAASDHQDRHHGHKHNAADAARRLDGRIAALKAELKITDAQAPLFDKVADAMRQNAAERHQAHEQIRGERDKPHSAIERLETRSRFAQLRAQQTDRLLVAFKPLYGSLSPDQKQAADDLVMPHHGHHGWRRRAGPTDP
jgi:hypothetical protein